MDNTKKLVVISGGSKGIGKAIVEIFAHEGFRIVTCSRNESLLTETKLEIEAKYNVQVDIFKADLSVKTEVDKFVEFITQINLPIEVLVNNAGVFIPGQIHTEDDQALPNMIDSNLYSAYYLTKGLISTMIANKCGHIFNICSTASMMAYPNGGSYSISKFALYGFSKSLREELKEYHIRVTSVLPGATFTSSWEGVDLPEERFMKAQDIAQAVISTYQLSERTVIEDLVLRPQLGDL